MSNITYFVQLDQRSYEEQLLTAERIVEIDTESGEIYVTYESVNADGSRNIYELI